MVVSSNIGLKYNKVEEEGCKVKVFFYPNEYPLISE